MAKEKKNTIAIAEELAAPILEEMGLELWDVRFEKEGSGWFLRYFIDKPGGVDINDCERFSRAVDPLLDAADPIDQSYCLEVSSPGVERELVRDEHFAQFIGADIMVKMLRPVEGIGKEFNGKLKAYDDGVVTVEDHSGENELTFRKKEAAWIKLDDF